MNIILHRSLILGLLLAIFLASCSNKDPEYGAIYTRVSANTINDGDPMPPIQGEPILTLLGDIGLSNEPVQFDIAIIEQLGQVEHTILDPFEMNQNTFQGVLLRDLLDFAQINWETATEIEVMALNDYSVSMPIEMIKTYPILLALKTNGAYMERSYRGPSMLVLPYQDYDFGELNHEKFWVWQIASLQVK